MREGTAAAWPENDEELGAGYNALEEEGKGLEGREDTAAAWFENDEELGGGYSVVEEEGKGLEIRGGTAAAWFENDDELGLMLAEGSTVAALVEDNKGLGYVST